MQKKILNSRKVVTGVACLAESKVSVLVEQKPSLKKTELKLLKR